MDFPEIVATNVSFDYSFLSLDDSESICSSSSSLVIFLILVGVTESLLIETYNLLLYNGTTKVLYASIY